MLLTICKGDYVIWAAYYCIWRSSHIVSFASKHKNRKYIYILYIHHMHDACNGVQNHSNNNNKNITHTHTCANRKKRGYLTFQLGSDFWSDSVIYYDYVECIVVLGCLRVFYILFAYSHLLLLYVYVFLVTCPLSSFLYFHSFGCRVVLISIFTVHFECSDDPRTPVSLFKTVGGGFRTTTNRHNTSLYKHILRLLNLFWRLWERNVIDTDKVTIWRQISSQCGLFFCRKEGRQRQKKIILNLFAKFFSRFGFVW